MRGKWKRICLPLFMVALLLFSGCSAAETNTESSIVSESIETITETPTPTESITESVTPTEQPEETTAPTAAPTQEVNLSDIPDYSGTPYVALNNNVPDFTADELVTESFESYSALDNLGRCGVAYACIGTDIMPTEERDDISDVYPSGWEQAQYDIVDGGYLYNRCHLIGFQLTGENANEDNLITGTKYLNNEGMLPFENMVADYIKETGNHVLYRVTPVFEGNNLVASGVHIEAQSVEDNGDGILFNVYCYNVQPGITIDYATGSSALNGESIPSDSTQAPTTAPSVTQQAPEGSGQVSESTYILNTNSHKFHLPSCSSVDQMSDKNKREYSGSRDDLIQQGYEPCQRCNP